MKRLHGNVNIIENIDDFFEWCDCARATIDYAAQFNTVQETWVFESGYANWVEGKFTAIFRMAEYPPNPEHVLSISIAGDAKSGFAYAVQVKNP